MSRTEQMIFAAIILAMLLAGVAAQAASVTVTWTNPTQRADGSPLSSSEITSTQVQWGKCA